MLWDMAYDMMNATAYANATTIAYAIVIMITSMNSTVHFIVSKNHRHTLYRQLYSHPQ